MDYSKLSDFEINAAVECERDESYRFMEFDEEKDEFIYCDPTGENCQRIKPRDYCNNPSDAWPIILDSKIDIRFEGGFMNKWEAQHVKHLDDYDVDIIGNNYDKNPLRAAMIVYLMMREAK